MKLYATVQSERASKGQGGNEYLDIDITVGDVKNPVMLARLTVKYTNRLADYGVEEEGAGFVLVNDDDEAISWWNSTTQTPGEYQLGRKGKKQKGEA